VRPRLIWGAGAIAQLPTNSDDELGNDCCGVRQSGVVLRIEKHWVYRTLFNNVWSVSSSNNDPGHNNFLMQPFLNYNF